MINLLHPGLKMQTLTTLGMILSLLPLSLYAAEASEANFIFSYDETRETPALDSQKERTVTNGKSMGTIRNDTVWRDTDGNEITGTDLNFTLTRQ